MQIPAVLIGFLVLSLLVCLVNLLIVSSAAQRQSRLLFDIESPATEEAPLFRNGTSGVETSGVETSGVQTSGAAEANQATDSGDGLFKEQAGQPAVLDALARETRRSWFWSRMSMVTGLLNVLALAWLAKAWMRAESDRLARAREQRLADQRSVLALLDQMRPLGEGDLRARATEGDGFTAALAANFNRTVDEIRWLVSTIDGSASAVSHTGARSHGMARSTSRACNVQAREIHRASNYLTAISGAMTQLSALAAESSRKSQHMVGSAQRAMDDLGRSLASLEKADETAEHTLQLMRRLSENADAIDARAAAVREVTRRTDLLAINSTIQVVAAGRQDEPGRVAADDGLARLAAEVQELANILGTATREITALTDTIGQDVDATIDAMSRTRVVLLAGIDETESASHRLDDIDRLARELQSHVVEMASRSVKQSGVLRKIGENMSVINDLTRQTANEVRVNAGELEQLHELAADLRSSVAGFRLPEASVTARKSVADDTRTLRTSGDSSSVKSTELERGASGRESQQHA